MGLSLVSENRVLPAIFEDVRVRISSKNEIHADRSQTPRRRQEMLGEHGGKNEVRDRKDPESQST